MRLGLTNSVQEQMFENRFWAVTFYLGPLDLFCVRPSMAILAI